MTEIAVWFLVSLVSSIVQTVSGFGYAIVALAILPLLIPDIPLIAAEISCIAVWVSVMNLLRKRNRINYRIIIPELISFLLVQPLAVEMSLRINVRIITAILGLVLIAFSFFIFFKPNDLRVPTKWYIGFIAGALSGMIGGMFAISGPPVALYLLSSSKDREEYIETLSFHFVVTSIYVAVIRISMGVLTISAMPVILVGTAGLGIGYFVGRKLYARIRDELFSKCVCIFTGTAGLYYVVVNLIG